MGQTIAEDGSQLEGKILKFLIVISIGIHGFFIFVDPSLYLSDSEPIVEEMVIDAALIPDFDDKGAKDSALPNAAKAKEILVEKKILPQLPKKFKLEEKAPKKEELAEEALPKPKNNGKSDTVKDEIVPKQIDEKVTKVKKKEALARLLKEMARKEKKFAKKTSAPLSKKLAQRKAELEKGSLAGAEGSGLSKIKMNKYRTALTKAIRRVYAVPEAYNLKDADLSTTIAITLTSDGELRDLDIETSSGDATFDQLALKTVRDAVPLPKPPREFLGQRILFVFSPKTL